MTYQLLVFIAVVAWARSDVTLNDCPQELPRTQHLHVFGHSCYIFDLDHHYEFSTSESLCQAGGGHLVSIRDLATQNFLYHTVKDVYGYNGEVWIGLIDKWTGGHYQWLDGSLATFTYWAYGQPGNYFGLGDYLEDCVVMDISQGGKWYDMKCDDFFFFRQHKPFICEYALAHNTTTTTTTTATPQPTTPQPTTPQPTTPQPTTSQPTTATPRVPTTTNPQPTTPPPIEECPPFECNLDCGLMGYPTDARGCLMCKCAA